MDFKKRRGLKNKNGNIDVISSMLSSVDEEKSSIIIKKNELKKKSVKPKR